MSSPVTTKEPLVEIRNLDIAFSANRDAVRVVKSVNLVLEKGKTLGIVGESGSGKTLLGLSLLGLLPPGGRVLGGEINFEGTNLVGASAEKLASIRGSRIGMVFQEPMM